MSIKPFLSRRNFMKSTAMASSALLGISSLSACSETENNNRKAGKFPKNTIKNYQPSDGVSGLLFSQIGYELGLPVRIIVRLPKKALLRGQTTCKLIPSLQEKSYQTDLKYWGEIWGSHWWIADFRAINETGEWNIEVIDGKECVYNDSGLRVGKNILWNETFEYASVDMLERRRHFTGVGAGWQDAGTLWVESPAQSAMIISLEELLEKKKEVFDSVFLERIYTQITVGCEYLVMTQAKAEELGFPKGAMSHDIKGHEKDILPHDAMKAVVALAKAVQLLPEEFADKKQKYSETATKAFQWLVTSAKEPSWCHGIVPSEKGVEFGADMGGIYPNYLMPLIDLLELWPNHDDAPKWKECLHSFAYHYLIPACEQNPFNLAPQGIFGDEGAIWFCGTFHGTNAIYGYTAALALELSTLFNEPKLKEIAYANLQWLAGLNGGITKENLKQGCVVFSTDVPEGAALPASMVCGVGNRWAGTWFQTRGVICNGFSTGEQFKYDTEPKKVNDGPFSLTDEDWIPHSAGWLTGLMRL